MKMPKQHLQKSVIWYLYKTARLHKYAPYAYFDWGIAIFLRPNSYLTATKSEYYMCNYGIFMKLFE